MSQSETLELLLERARWHVPTPEELAEERISFAYGNAVLANPNITQETIREADRKLNKP